MPENGQLSQEQPLISVIVPVYNVEAWLGPCLDSILAQTYQKLEILLIDDGSADRSGAICDEYKERDSRIQVVHQANAGQAAARNRGVALAAGVFLLFIDSDDLVSTDYAETLYGMAKRTGARLSVCGFRPFYEGETPGLNACPAAGSGAGETVTDACQEKVMDACQALESLFYKKEITASPCYRLFHRDVFSSLRFEEGRIFEDMGLMYQAVDAAGTVAYTPRVLYFYRQRKGSTMHQAAFTQRRMDRLYFSEKMLEFARQRYPRLIPAARARYFVSCYLILSELPSGPAYGETRRMLKKAMKQDCLSVAKDSKAPKKTRLMASLCCVSATLTQAAGKLLRRYTSQS